jgi:hypothetical protein
MRLVFVHGIHEEDKAPAALQQTWENALLSAWTTAGLAKPNYTLEMPYYGTLLASLTHHTRRVVGNMASGIEGIVTRVEEALIHAVGKAKASMRRDFAPSWMRASWVVNWQVGSGFKASYAFSNSSCPILVFSC